MISLKNMDIKANELRDKLAAEQTAKEEKANKQVKPVDDVKFKPELVGIKTVYKLRILPNIFVNEGQAEPWVKTNVHIFVNPHGQKKFALCPTTLDAKAPCPLCEKSKTLYKKVNAKEATQAEEKAAKNYYRSNRYFLNVLVKSDDRQKNNQGGKVLIWEFGPQIFEKLKECLLDQKKVFHAVKNGYDFNLVVKKKGDYINYESSFFDGESSPVATTDDELDRITQSIHNLTNYAIKKGPMPYDKLVELMNGIEPQRQQSEYDSATRATTTAPFMSPSVGLDSEVDLEETPKSKQTLKSTESTESTKQLTDDELLKELENL